jgi:hypothetical protein
MLECVIPMIYVGLGAFNQDPSRNCTLLPHNSDGKWIALYGFGLLLSPIKASRGDCFKANFPFRSISRRCRLTAGYMQQLVHSELLRGGP